MTVCLAVDQRLAGTKLSFAEVSERFLVTNLAELTHLTGDEFSAAKWEQTVVLNSSSGQLAVVPQAMTNDLRALGMRQQAKVLRGPCVLCCAVGISTKVCSARILTVKYRLSQLSNHHYWPRRYVQN